MSERAFLADLLALIDQHGPFGDFTGSIVIVFATIRVQQSIRRGPVPKISGAFCQALEDLIRQHGAGSGLEGLDIHFHGGSFRNFNAKRPYLPVDRQGPGETGSMR